VKLRVDRSKNLHWWFSVDDGPFEPAGAVEDPWTSRAPDWHERRLLDHRRDMRPYAPNSIANPYGRYGNPYSPYSATNPYATKAPRLFGQDGKYLGRLSANPYDPESVSDPYGRYGSPYSPDSINNPYGRYGSPYSPFSPFNPYATKPPIIVGREP
jgi:hypothetical protein